MGNNKKIILFGCFIIFIGIITNPWLLENFLSPDNDINNKYKLFIGLFNILVIMAGFFIIKNRNQHIDIIPSNKNILLFFVTCLLCLVIMEVGLRLYLDKFADISVFQRYATYNMISKKTLRFKSHPYLGYVLNEKYVNEYGKQHNSLNFRGPEILREKEDEIFRIVCLGGSTTYGSSKLNFTTAYPYQLKLKLKESGFENVEVINAGTGDATTWYSLIKLEFNVLDLDPDLVIIYHGDNDFETRLVYPFDNYRSDNTGAIKRFYPKPSIINQSILARMLLLKIFGFKMYGYLDDRYGTSTWYHDDFLRQIVDGTYPRGIFKEITAMEMLKENKPVYTRRNYENMIAICEYHNIDILVLSFAYNTNSIETARVEYQLAIRETNDIINIVAEKSEAYFFDYAIEMSMEKKYWNDDGVHLTPAGNKLKAELIGEYLISQGYKFE